MSVVTAASQVLFSTLMLAYFLQRTWVMVWRPARVDLVLDNDLRCAVQVMVGIRGLFVPPAI